MIKYIREVPVVVLRKGVTQVGGRIGNQPIAWRGATLAYAFEIQENGEQARIQTVYLDYSRSKDFYRIPVGPRVMMRIGKRGDQVGLWLDSWALGEEADH